MHSSFDIRFKFKSYRHNVGRLYVRRSIFGPALWMRSPSGGGSSAKRHNSNELSSRELSAASNNNELGG